MGGITPAPRGWHEGPEKCLAPGSTQGITGPQPTLQVGAQSAEGPEPPEETSCLGSYTPASAVCRGRKRQRALSLAVTPSSIWKVLEDLCSSPAATPTIHHGPVSLPVGWARPPVPAHPSIGVLRRFIVVPEAKARDAFSSVEANGDHVVQAWREGDQPHVLVLHREVGSVD